MKKSEKEEFLKFIDSSTFPAISPSYLGGVIDTTVLKRYLENLPVDKDDSSTRDEDLVYCPFCGSENVRLYSESDDCYYVQCECGICTAICNNGNDAIRLWNDRI